ncbi:MAG: topoisomerase IV [Clostridiales bacterium]|jgi:DNA gyrase subunit A|nr:topoisomerase IV [Clostridiales bacterium]
MSDIPFSNQITEQNIAFTLEINYMPYAMSVIISRAIPEMDGLKPAHRKLLYTMYKMGLLNGNRIKSADVVGQTMRLNPHGDQAIYETLVRLTRGNDALLHPFIDSKGNFGKVYSRDMAYAASRYTEVKLTAICSELFKDIDKNTVDMIDNYNNSMKEPLLFPTTFPNLLVTPNQGIAVGMASTACSFNLKEVCEATIAYIKEKNCDFLTYLKAPDFSTGGQLLYNADELKTIYATGRGSFKVRAKYLYDSKQNCIEITEIPYTTTIETIIDKIIMLIKSGKLRDINDVRDETDLNGLRVTLDLKRGANPDLLMYKLYEMTPLCDSFNCNFNFLVAGRPHTMGIAKILTEWIAFRSECIKRQVAFDVQKKNAQAHLLDGLAIILLDIDKAIAIIRATEQDSQVIPNLMTGFEIDKIQAEFIAEIKLRNLNKEHILSRIKEIENLKKEIAELNNLLSSEKKIEGLIVKQLKEIAKKYGKPRRTEIVYEEEKPEYDELIEDYGIKLFLTQHNYFKKITLASLRSASEQYLKDGDEIAQELETTNKSDILFFSNNQNVYKVKAHELSECKASGMGEFLTNTLGLQDGEKIVFIAATTDYDGDIIFAFVNGKIAKISMDLYSTKANRKKLVNAYSDKSKLVYASHIRVNTDFIAIRDKDKALLFNTDLLPLSSSKNATGTQVMTLRKNSKLTALIQADKYVSDNAEYYRTEKLPTGGHFISEIERIKNGLKDINRIQNSHIRPFD